MINVIIADDHRMLREGFKTLLRKEEDIQIIGEAQNGRELLELLKVKLPDAIITDIQMPEIDGLEVTKRVRALYPGVAVIALSMHTENSTVIDMLKAGAKGYLTKNTTREELVEAIKTVTEGGNYFCEETSVSLTRLIDQNRLNPYNNVTPVKLTPKEISIIQFICQEYSSKQIAPLVNLTKRTVDNYREKIQEKIDAKTVVGLVLYAIRNRLFTLD